MATSIYLLLLNPKLKSRVFITLSELIHDLLFIVDGLIKIL